ncbi:penicillin acylase family protein [Spirosoma utsteinense]|uniref:Penicillin amidase n=1 Tax=Spirosoma utsteinense TaxID=2585773 RepID=A0ABR6WCQ6_9BACT|nr:penicillin acylase family protein [Spirosoma utsteinense]MBC3786909.1 penicillin amidase [Spirosoma utsteinense]MBC3794288.1 penicillin amidase [Spirosoma utsteinense]
MLNRLVSSLSLCLAALSYACSQPTQTLKTPGLQQPVEIIRDRWGVNHIYAKNEHDLFFAQGYSAARDRLFQLEIWRRQATGTVSELLGPQETKRDVGTRLFRFRGDIDKELLHYHPHGPLIVRAFVAGINAYITEILKTPDALPFEFKVLQTKPALWTPEVVISRHQGLLGNVRDELNYGRLVKLIGAGKLRELQWFHPVTKPTEPDLTLHVDGDALFQPILELYEAFRLPLKFGGRATKADEDEAWVPGPSLTPGPSRNGGPPIGRGVKTSGLVDVRTACTPLPMGGPPLREGPGVRDEWFETEKQYVGSNNWIISGNKSTSGYPMLANDPHRAQSTPSLRYWVHLNAPGWNVIGAGEPTLPGISIGHNDYGAWGLTIFETDNEDLYVYDTNPNNTNEYAYRGKGTANRWVAMKTRTERIPMKNGTLVTATLKYTQHGPVVFEDKARHKAYAIRAGWLEQGCAPYLASLRMNQAKNWTEFRQACSYSRIPGENMIWADKTGTIGWQAVGLSPIRKNYTGLVPVPGDGRFEWSGYLPIQQLPNKLNPAEGYVVTANNNLTPVNFPNRNAIGWTWAGPSRAHRIEEVLNDGKRKNLVDFMALQADYLSIPARTLVPLLQNLSSPNDRTEQALTYLRKWDYKLDPSSVPAAIYVAWEGQLKQAVAQYLIPRAALPYMKTLPSKRVIDWLVVPRPSVAGAGGRDSLLLACLDRAVAELTNRLGKDPDDWSYGQRKNKHITITHPLSDLVDPAMQQQINLGPVARGGYGETVNATANDLNQTHGASFRILVDTEDWDKTMGINSPGQSGDPASPHYRDLFPIWAENGYFPVFFSKDKVNEVAEQTSILTP